MNRTQILCLPLLVRFFTLLYLATFVRCSVTNKSYVNTMTGKIEFLRMNAKGCSTAILTVGSEELQCIVSIWYQGEFPLWIQSSDIVEDIRKATEDEIRNFTAQICTCNNVDVSPSCGNDVRSSLDTLLEPCHVNETTDNTTGVPLQGVVAELKKMVDDVKLLEKANLLDDVNAEEEQPTWNKSSDVEGDSFTEMITSTPNKEASFMENDLSTLGSYSTTLQPTSIPTKLPISKRNELSTGEADSDTEWQTSPHIKEASVTRNNLSTIDSDSTTEHQTSPPTKEVLSLKNNLSTQESDSTTQRQTSLPNEEGSFTRKDLGTIEKQTSPPSKEASSAKDDLSTVESHSTTQRQTSPRTKEASSTISDFSTVEYKSSTERQISLPTEMTTDSNDTHVSMKGVGDFKNQLTIFGEDQLVTLKEPLDVTVATRRHTQSEEATVDE